MKGRLASVDADVTSFALTLQWDYRYLEITSYSRSANASVKQFEPLFLRTFSTILTNAKIPSMPNIIIDMGQWRESFALQCYMEGEYLDMARDISELRTWIRTTQGNVGKRMFLQLFPEDNGIAGNQRLDPGLNPFGSVPGYGYRGMVTAGPSEKYNAGERKMEYSLVYTCGVVMPL